MIRTRIIKQGYIKGIIGLPANLFYGTSIPACIIVMDKEGAAGRRGIFMIDASKGFIKDGNKNRLRAQDIHKIVDTFTRQVEIGKYSRLVPSSEISANDFNLNLPRYIDSSEAEDLHDIEAHLLGGIPNRDIDGLSAYWQVFPSLRQELCSNGARPGYCQLKLDPNLVKPTIFGHAEFVAFKEQSMQRFIAWKERSFPLLTGIKIGDRPKILVDTISENLLETFRNGPLIDAYDIYQHLMDYWAETMQDDAWMIATDGWQAMQDGKPNTDLIPANLVTARYFSDEQASIELLEAKRDAINRRMEEMDEEHGGEDGLLNDAKTEKGKISAKSIKDRLTSIKSDSEAHDERKVLETYASLIDQEAVASKKVKEAQKALNAKVMAQYVQLTEVEIKALVVDDKWLGALVSSLNGELNRVSQLLAARIKQLAERYAKPLPLLVDEMETLSASVTGHLEKMGFVWK